MTHFAYDNCESNVMAKSGKKSKTGGVAGANALMTIPPEQIELLRKGVFNVVKQNVPRVREVLDGTRQWNPQQVKLYLSLLNKVMPDLNQSYNEHHHTKSHEEMTVDELKDLVAKEIGKLTAIEAMPTNDPDIPLEAKVATLLNNPLLLSADDTTQ